MTSSPRGIVLTYHAVEAGPRPLFVTPGELLAHLDVIEASGAQPLTLSQIVAGLRGGGLPARWCALTFDDGYASVVDAAAPALAERGWPATVFCLAGRLGRDNAWPSQPERVPVRPLAGASALAALPAAGIAIGSHGTDHVALAGADPVVARREVADSRHALEQALGLQVEHFALPYAAPPSAAARALIRDTYDGAFGGGDRAARVGADPFAVPRVDAHYLRRPAMLRRALEGLDAHLTLRRAGSRLRRPRGW